MMYEHLPQAPAGVPLLARAYRAVRDGCRNGDAVRFVGSSTDGGMDDTTTAYWVDHMFLPGGYAVYCSRSAPNVHCVGLLKVRSKAALHVYNGPHECWRRAVQCMQAWPGEDRQDLQESLRGQERPA